MHLQLAADFLSNVPPFLQSAPPVVDIIVAPTTTKQSVSTSLFFMSVLQNSMDVLPAPPVMMVGPLTDGGWSVLPNVPALLSLIPIASGVAAASWNTPTFEAIGFAAAVEYGGSIRLKCI
jgi:hypothetical protein